jgi:predicted  nucleic acid-binding Zn-ribbon protein
VFLGVEVDPQATVHWLTALARLEEKLENLRVSEERADRRSRDFEELIQEGEAELASASSRVEATGKDLRRLEREVQDLEAKIDQKRQHLDLIRDNKEYRALQAEISALADGLDAKETEVLQVLERIETDQQQVDRLEKELAAQREERSTQRANRQKRVSATRSQHEELVHEIKTVTSQLQAEIVTTLDRIRAKAGLPVVWLDGEACGGCHAHFPTQTALGIAQGNLVVRCQTCGRFVVAKG